MTRLQAARFLTEYGAICWALYRAWPALRRFVAAVLFGVEDEADLRSLWRQRRARRALRRACAAQRVPPVADVLPPGEGWLDRVEERR